MRDRVSYLHKILDFYSKLYLDTINIISIKNKLKIFFNPVFSCVLLDNFFN